MLQRQRKSSKVAVMGGRAMLRWFGLIQFTDLVHLVRVGAIPSNGQFKVVRIMQLRRAIMGLWY